MSMPPPMLDGAHVLWWAWSGDVPFGRLPTLDADQYVQWLSAGSAPFTLPGGAAAGRLTFAKGSEPFLADSDLMTPADFVGGPIDYLRRHVAYDFKPPEGMT